MEETHLQVAKTLPGQKEVWVFKDPKGGWLESGDGGSLGSQE